MNDYPPSPYGQFKHVISLGINCQAAHQIRRVLNIESAHVFDWLISPHAALKKTFQSRFKGFFDRERLTVGDKNRVIDKPTGLQFFHDFNEGDDIDSSYDEKREKYNELVRRFLGILDGTEPTLFVRQQSGRGDSRQLAEDLRSTIFDIAPQLPFSLLYVTDHIEDVASGWNSNRILYRSVAKPVPHTWTGDDLTWEQVLKEALSRRLDQNFCQMSSTSEA